MIYEKNPKALLIIQSSHSNMNLKIISIIAIIILLTGCQITGYVTKEISKAETVEDKDLKLMAEAVNEKSPSKCNFIQTQNIREQCFISLASILNDSSICNSLLAPSPRDKCLEQFS
jgi:PBP1b-binding outer membrane lipoprotein LpoB